MENKIITIEKLITYRRKKSQWLKTHIVELADIFDLSLRALDVLKTVGVYQLKDLLVYHKEELLNAELINLNALTTTREKNIAKRVNYKRERNRTNSTRKRNRKVGKKSMEEIEVMLKKLNMPLRKTL